MFGANKRLRDLGKDTMDYTNYNSPSAKVKRYRQQVYGTNTTNYSGNNNKTLKPFVIFIILFFVVPTVLPFFFMFVEFFTIFDAIDGDDIEYTENNTIIHEEEKFDEYEEEWVKKYYTFFNTQGININNSEFSFVDLDFNGIPEVFYKTDTTYNGQTYHINRVYYVDDYENIKFTSVLGDGVVKLYYSNLENKFLWLSPSVTQYTSGHLFKLYRFDDVKRGKIFNLDYSITNKDMFETNCFPSAFTLVYYDINEFDKDYYEIVDDYLLEAERINNFMNDYNK